MQANDQEKIVIFGYELDRPLTNDNAGFSKWGFGEKDGKKYFIKEFLSPKYPVDDGAISPEQKNGKIRICNDYQKEKLRLYNAINNCSDGNLMRIHEFFRWDSTYYITTEIVTGNKLDVRRIGELPEKNRMLICLIVAHAIAMLHSCKIVHADLKPDNIIITNDSAIRAKVIDFDCSFFEDNSPELGDDLNGDFVYLSPEGFKHIAEIESNLSCKMDIFALGIIFHQFLTGQMPEYNNKKYQYIYEAVLDGGRVSCDAGMNEKCRNIIEAMLRGNPADRPDAAVVYNEIAALYSAMYGTTPQKINHVETVNVYPAPPAPEPKPEPEYVAPPAPEPKPEPEYVAQPAPKPKLKPEYVAPPSPKTYTGRYVRIYNQKFYSYSADGRFMYVGYDMCNNPIYLTYDSKGYMVPAGKDSMGVPAYFGYDQNGKPVRLKYERNSVLSYWCEDAAIIEMVELHEERNKKMTVKSQPEGGSGKLKINVTSHGSENSSDRSGSAFFSSAGDL